MYLKVNTRVKDTNPVITLRVQYGQEIQYKDTNRARILWVEEEVKSEEGVCDLSPHTINLVELDEKANTLNTHTLNPPFVNMNPQFFYHAFVCLRISPD